MDPKLSIPLLGLLAPAVIGLAVALLTFRPRRSDADAGAGVGVLAAAGAIVALGVASLVSQWGIAGPVASLMGSSDGRLRVAAAVIAVAGLGALGLIVALGGRGAWLVAGVLGSLGAAVVAAPQLGLGGSATLVQKALMLGGVGAGCAAAAFGVSALLARGQRIASGAVLTGLAFAVGAAVLGTGGSKVGLMGIGTGAAILGMLAVVIFRRSVAIAPGAAACVVALLAALLMAGHAYANTPAWLAMGLATVPLAALGTVAVLERTALRSRPGLAGVAGVLVAAVLAGALVAPGLIALGKVESGSHGASDY